MNADVTTNEAGLSPVILHPGDGVTLNAFGDTIQVKLGAEHTGGTIALGLGITPPGGGPPPHRHHNEHELFVVVEGTLQFLANGEWKDVGPGGVVFLPRGSVHTFRNASDAPARHWVLTSPSGFETFFARCAAVFDEAGTGGPDMARIMQICGEHGIEFVPPLGPPPAAEAGGP